MGKLALRKIGVGCHWRRMTLASRKIGENRQWSLGKLVFKKLAFVENGPLRTGLGRAGLQWRLALEKLA